MVVVANICPENVIFCSILLLIENLVPLGMLRVQAAGKIQAMLQVKKVRLISEYIKCG